MLHLETCRDPPDKAGSVIWGQIYWPCEPGALCHFHGREYLRAFWTDGRALPSVIQKCQDFQKQMDAKKLPSIFSGALKRATIYRCVGRITLLWLAKETNCIKGPASDIDGQKSVFLCCVICCLELFYFPLSSWKSTLQSKFQTWLSGWVYQSSACAFNHALEMRIA